MLLLSALVPLVLVLAEPTAPAASATAPPVPDGDPGIHRPGNYVHLSPGLVGFTPVADAAAVAYVWGIAGGRYFTAGKRFAGAAGGFGEHMMLWHLSGDSGGVPPPIHEVRLGGELRLGARTRRIFAYGIGRIGAALTLDYDVPEYNADYTEEKNVHYAVYPWVMGSVGAGLQGSLGRRFLIGGEQFFDIGAEAFFLVRFRLLLGVRF